MRKRCSLVIENVYFFPEEILYEILSWLRVKSLLRYKPVCKIWYAVIKNKQFVEMHAVRNGHRFCNTKRRCKLLNSDGTKEEFLSLSYCCKGLLLVKKLSFASVTPTARPTATYQICNPATKRILDLPCPNDSVKTMMLFFNSSTSSYNVVLVYFGGKNKNEKLEFLDLGRQSNGSSPNASLSWRSLNISEFDNFSRQQRYFFRYCMSNKGVLYILALKIGQPSKPKIICADLIKQTCTTLNSPKRVWLEWHEVDFQLWKSQPSIVFIFEEKLNVWMLEDYKGQKWADTIVIPMPFLTQNPLMKMVIPRICQVDEEDYLCYPKDKNSDVVYKLASKELCTIPSVPLRVPATLASVKGMQPRKNNAGARYIGFGQKHIIIKKQQ